VCRAEDVTQELELRGVLRAAEIRLKGRDIQREGEDAYRQSTQQVPDGQRRIGRLRTRR
jgi:hypothetical protein